MSVQEGAQKYPEFSQLRITEKPSSYLPLGVGLDLAMIVEARDDVRRLQLEFIAKHSDPITVVIREEGQDSTNPTVWTALSPNPLYVPKIHTHLWLLVDESGENFYPLMQSAIEEIVQPDEDEPTFRILITKEADPDLIKRINPNVPAIGPSNE